MSSANIGYLYYKEYYNNEMIKNEVLKRDNEKEKNNYFSKKNNEIISNSNIEMFRTITNDIQGKLYKDKIYFKTTYPGLIVGIGYSHMIKQKEEFKLGLEFDYTIGLPVINGSSVKGVLRSAFYNDKDNEELKKEKEKYVKGILRQLKLENDYIENINFKDLTYSIFEGKYKDKDDKYTAIPMNERDIFFGATIDIQKTSSELENGYTQMLECINNKSPKEDKLCLELEKEHNKILGEDYITPHNEEKEKSGNPNPIKFLKVMPNVVWCFGFDLKDEYNEKKLNHVCITKNIKRELFKQIILDFGIGAKTNVGYGRFESNLTNY